MAGNIHPTAVIDPRAEIGADCEIGPYCVLGPDVALGARCRLHSHVVIEGHTSLGDECEVFPFACLGGKTQDLKYRGDVTYVRIGARNSIREYVTVHAATTAGGATTVGDDCLIQAYCHIAHECQLGNGVIVSSGAMMAGHVEVGDHAVIAGMAGIVQFCRIGTMAMVGGYSKLVQDALPYCITDGIPAETRVINKIGMERHGKDAATVQAVMKAFRKIIRSGLPLEQAAAELRESHGDVPEVMEMVAFAQSSQRGLPRPAAKQPQQ